MGTLPSDVVHGAFEVRGEGDAAEISVAISSEAPVQRAFGLEVLDHAPGSVDMERAALGLPLILQHDTDGPLPVGRIEQIRIDPDKIMRGVPRFSRREEAQVVRQDVLDGIVTDVSVGYTRNLKKVRQEGDTFRFLDWKPVEVSFCSVPQDIRAGINRSAGVTTMNDPQPAPSPSGDDDGRDTRELALSRAFRPYMHRAGVTDILSRHIEAGSEELTAMRELLDHLGTAGDPPAGPASPPSDVRPGEDAREKFARAAENNLLVRSGIANEEEIAASRANEYLSYRMTDLAREMLRFRGVDIAGMDPVALVGRAIDPGTANLDTTDLSSVLEAAVNKAVFRGFDETVRTWDIWCSTNSVPDFKQYSRPGLSAFTDLAVVAENGSITDGIMTDKTEKGTLETYARKLSLTRQAIINDDLGTFIGNATKMGEAAQRTLDRNVYTVLNSNPVLNEDAVALFAAGHNNLVTPGGAPDETTVQAAITAMARQVDPNSIEIEVVPSFLVAASELEFVVQNLAVAEFSPNTGDKNQPNTVRGRFQPVITNKIPAAQSDDWYLMGQKGTTMEVNFLNGQTSPTIERDEGWTVLAMHWRVYMDWDVLPLDFRGMQKNEGGVAE